MIDEKNINKCRREIDELDAKIIELFERRLELARKIAGYKQSGDFEIRDLRRESQLLARVSERSIDEFCDYNLKLFEKIMEISREYQQRYTEENPR